MRAFFAEPITAVDTIVAALAGGLIVGWELYPRMVGLGSVVVGNQPSRSRSPSSFDRVSSADQERSEEIFGNVRKGFGEIRNV